MNQNKSKYGYLKAIYYIPFSFFLVLNVTLLFIIFLLRNIGKFLVWGNNHISDTGDYFYDKTAKDSLFDEKMEEYIDRANNFKKARKRSKNHKER